MGEAVNTIAAHPIFADRAAGVLFHLTSLPDRGRGLDSARHFADWLAEAGVKWWQVLPVGPVPNPNWSPYSALSSFQLGDFVDGNWNAFREHCHQNGISLLGDVPIFVPMDSDDVRDNPHLFRLDSSAKPTVLTGVPPDNYSPTGQLWGHPHYDWDAHAADDYQWWLRRFEFHLELFDAVRIDHFIGFHHAWEVEAGEATAAHGVWGPAPGREILAALSKNLNGPLPLLAEDLGHITQEVIQLRDDYSLPGMFVLQDGHEPNRSHSFAYTGTHDTDTTRGWLERKGFNETVWSWIERLWNCPSNNVIVPMQDLLNLDSTARMNVPGTTSGNWCWQLDKEFLGSNASIALATKLRDLTVNAGRQNK